MRSAGTPWPRMFVGNVAVDLVGREQALSLILDALSASNPLAVASVNLHHIHHFADDESWIHRPPAVSLNGPAHAMRWLVLLDGVPLVRSANALTGRRWPKLSGSDLIYPILESAARLGVGVGFLGGAVDTHHRLRELVGERFPDIRIAGTWAPTRSELTNRYASEQIATEIRNANVDILVVGLTKPLGEGWITRFGPATGARILLEFGAAIDYLAQQVPRAPDWVAQAGAEWAWRLMLEPRRLGRRYLIQGPPALIRLKRSARVVEAGLLSRRRDGVELGRFAAGGEHADVTAVVVTYNSADDISELIDDLRLAARERPIRLVIVDNQSSDETINVVRAHDDIILVESAGNIGYAGGVNAGLAVIGDCDSVLILNPDLRLAPDAITQLLAAADDERIGAVVPLILDDGGAVYRSLRREPSISRAIGDALLGSRIRGRPAFLTEIDCRPRIYREAHDVDWATGAALLVPAAVVCEVGEWNEEFFLYSEEIDYFRRIRARGRRIRFEPSAVVQHRGGGSGTSPDLLALMAVNRVRYVKRHHGRVYSGLFHAVVALGVALRCYRAVDRHIFGAIVNPSRWHELPRASKHVAVHALSGHRERGAVIIPAYNEETVIERTLTPLSPLAKDGYIELVVACNGCTDATADVARNVPGALVLELEQRSKPAALNAGDEAANLWPRLYLDADIQISAEAVLAVLDRLAKHDVLVARPDFRYDSRGASALVRSYYRARKRIPQFKRAMWGAGVYGLSAKGHQRFGDFPLVTGDDLYVDTRFDAHEKVVVGTDPSVVTTPTDAKSLLAILRRNRQGGLELLAAEQGRDRRFRVTSRQTAISVFATVRGPLSALDATVYAGISLAQRWRYPEAQAWERDESSRSSK